MTEAEEARKEKRKKKRKKKQKKKKKSGKKNSETRKFLWLSNNWIMCQNKWHLIVIIVCQ